MLFRARAVRLASLCFAAASLTALPALATPDARSAAEIDQLLGKVAHSGCTFIRSGSEYSGADARKHLEFKLGFVRARLSTAEEFITHLASKSSSTGEPYHIRCEGKDSAAETWLNAQLKGIRGQH